MVIKGSLVYHTQPEISNKENTKIQKPMNSE